MTRLPVGKQRLDVLVVERGLVASKTKAKAVIMAGEITVDGQRVDKAGTAVSIESKIELRDRMPYVSRGGYKLAGALDVFGLDVTGRICADVGACTGGFTDVLLQRGASRVYTIDVGLGQLAWKLRQDPRVVVMERTNARYLTSLPEPITFVAIDVAFISLKLVLPAVEQWLARTADVVAMIKPQFEAEPELVGKGGVIRDPAVHRIVVEDILGWAAAQDWELKGLVHSAITGAEGNVEFLVWLGNGDSPDEGWQQFVEPLFMEQG